MRLSALFALLLSFALPGVAAAQNASGAQAPGVAPGVVVSVKPLHSLTAAVMQGVGTPHLLVQGAASPHAYAMKPSDARALSQAALVVWVGPELETFLRKPLASLSGPARDLRLAQAPGVKLHETREGGAWDDHSHGHGHGHDHGHAHDHGGPDGHIWLDPTNAKAIAAAVAAALTRVDPTNAATYAANLAALTARLDALDAEIAAMLAPVKDRPYIVFHDAYQYLERRYGLNAAGAITVSPEVRPGAARLSALRARIAKAGAVCVFAEPQFEPTLVRTLVEGTKARTGTLDPEGAAIPDGPDLYFTLLRFNAKALVDCLS